jgi:hypothetical protein
MSGPTASNPLDICGTDIVTCIGNALKRQIQIYTELLQLHPSRRRKSSSSVISRLQPCKSRIAKEKRKTSVQGILWEDVII